MSGVTVKHVTLFLHPDGTVGHTEHPPVPRFPSKCLNTSLHPAPRRSIAPHDALDRPQSAHRALVPSHRRHGSVFQEQPGGQPRVELALVAEAVRGEVSGTHQGAFAPRRGHVAAVDETQPLGPDVLLGGEAMEGHVGVCAVPNRAAVPGFTADHDGEGGETGGGRMDRVQILFIHIPQVVFFSTGFRG